MDEEYTYQTLYRETIPSVVSIYQTGGDRGGAGSGFVFDAGPDGEGDLVTNHHVVRGATEVDVRFSDGEWRVGRVVGTDPYTDLAVVRVADLPADARPLPVAETTPDPGVPVAAFGNPMGLDGSIAVGIVSGASRSMATGNGFALPDTVQTDAAINPGNSGGPLVAMDGTVVGANRAKAGDNVGFAVSPEIMNRVVPALAAEGEYRHSYLRIRTLDVAPSVATANGLDEPGGVLVLDVHLGPSSGVLKGCCGTREVRDREVPVGGDVVVAIDGSRVDSHEQLTRYLIVETEPGDVVEVELLRDGERLTEQLTLGERPDPPRRRRGRRQRRGARENRDDGGRIPIR